MFRPEEVPTLQRAAEDEVVRRSFKLTGIFSLLFGALALFTGVAPPADLVLAAVGAVLAIAGLWNLVMKSPAGLLLSAIALAVVGAYNMASPFLVAADGGKPFTGWAILGFWQIVWGWQGYRRWQRFRGALSSETPGPLRQRVVALIDGVRKADVKKNADVVELVVGGLAPALVRVRLVPDGVVCLVGGGEDVRLAARSQVALEVENEAAAKKVGKATLRLGDQTWKGSMRAEHVARFRHWQGGTATMSKAA